LLNDPKLRSQVDSLWDKFWTGGLTNPLDAIEQFSYLLFLKRLDDRENAAERQAKRKGTPILQEEFAGVVARVESLRGRMSEGERQVEGLFESLLSEAFER